MQRILWAITIWATVASIMVLPATAVDIGGNLVLEYRNREGGTGLAAGTGNDQFRLVQTGLRLSHDFSDYNRFGASIVSGQGAGIGITEAWAEFGGLPYNGALTIGRFYKPLAAPLQTVGLPYTQLLFHSNAVQGAKIGMDYYPWRWELGVVNNYDLSATGSAISNSTAFGRPIVNAGASNHKKEGYAFLGWRDGGEWGSLDATAGFTYGSFNATDNATLRNIYVLFPGAILLPPSEANVSSRYLYEFSADYTYGPFRLSGDFARAKEGRLTMNAYNVTGGYRLAKYNFLLGYDRLVNNTYVRQLGVPASWERDRVTYGINYELHPNLLLCLEYEDNREDITSVNAARRQARDGIKNDGIVFQMLASF